ncbi:hypothetical protein LPJ53_004258 [Coemansia erecta]|uniref:Thioesterase domain-containing protein n=1 Tax=Coemansia erecta TaxID=147472 RepID=A0A9W8CR38_9FUNG|nr:hypothetical protein LPJ53_004258 [Coemansia erecta]
MAITNSTFVDAVNRNYELVNKYLHYGMDVVPRVTWASVDTNEFIAEWLVTSDYISSTGCIDEGCLGTITDNTTAMLIGSLVPGDKSVSTSISVQGVSPIAPQTTVEIWCRMSNRGTKQPHATAVFRDKLDPSRIYAVGTHTKFFKTGLVETQPKM